MTQTDLTSGVMPETRALVAQLKLQVEKSRALVAATQESLKEHIRAAEIRRKMKLEREEQDDKGQSRESVGGTPHSSVF